MKLCYSAYQPQSHFLLLSSDNFYHETSIFQSVYKYRKMFIYVYKHMQASLKNTILWVLFINVYTTQHTACIVTIVANIYRMDYTVPRAVLSPSFQFLCVESTVVVILFFRKSRYTEISVARGHTANQWWTWELFLSQPGSGA